MIDVTTGSPFKLTNSRGESLYAQSWESAIPAIGAVGILHGIGEHASRYDWLAKKLAAAGLRVFSYDQIGHGQSGGARGDVGDYAWLLDDIDSLLEVMRRQQGSLPIFLYGHSFGGNLVLNHALRRKSPVMGIIASSPLLLPTVQPPAWKQFVAQILCYLNPSFRFKTGIKATQLSRDPDSIAARNSDQMIHGQVSARLARQMLAAGRWALSHANELAIPALLLHGTADPVTDCQASREFARAATKECSLRTWPELLHELHWELEREDVVDAIRTWIKCEIGRVAKQ